MSTDTTRKIKMPNITTDNPDTEYLLNSLVKPSKEKMVSTYRRNDNHLSSGAAKSVTASVGERKKTNEHIINLFPEIELAIQILVSSVLSPKDMNSTNLGFKLSNSSLPSAVNAAALDVIKHTATQQFKFTDRLESIVREVLFESGAYVLAVLPRSSIDKLIDSNTNMTTESMNMVSAVGKIGKGLLGNNTNKTVSIESMYISPQEDYDPTVTVSTGNNKTLSLEVEIVDDVDLLKTPAVAARHRANYIESSISNEDAHTDPYSMYKDVSRGDSSVISIPGMDIPTVADSTPIVYKLPTESVIPVFTPSDPTDHIGYYVAIDSHGYPLSATESDSVDIDLDNLTENNNIAAALLKKAKSKVSDVSNRNRSPKELTDVYDSLIEAELLDRLTNGAYHMELEISRSDSLFKIMLARTLKGKRTRMVFLPKELVTYTAYKYYANGTGKSLLDGVSIIASLRALLMFSGVEAQIKNNINITEVNIGLDPNDPDPQKTIEIAAGEIIAMRAQGLPTGLHTPADITDWLSRAGFQFTFEGHPALPDTKIDINNNTMDHNVPDRDIDEDLKKSMIMAIGLSPEMVDNGFEGEHATTVVANHLLLAKRIYSIQRKLTPKWSEHIRKLCRYDKTTYDSLKNLMVDNKELLFPNETLSASEMDMRIHKHIVDTIASLTVSLPAPDMVKMKSLSDEYDAYKDSLEQAITAWISDTMFDEETVGEIGNKMDTIREVVQSHYLRRWMADNDYHPELSELTRVRDDGKPVLDVFGITSAHTESIIESIGGYIGSTLPTGKRASSKIETIEDTDYTEDDKTEII